jgi:hypothetical protein
LFRLVVIKKERDFIYLFVTHLLTKKIIHSRKKNPSVFQGKKKTKMASKATTILSRARREGRGSKLEEMVAQGLSSDDELAEFFNVKPAKKKSTTTASKTTKKPDEENKEKEKPQQEIENKHEDAAEKKNSDDDDDEDEDDDSTFSSSDLSHITEDKLDSDFGEGESDSDYDSDADELVQDKDIRREERQEARKEREKMMEKFEGNAAKKKSGTNKKDSNNNKRDPFTNIKRQKLTTTQEERMEIARKWAIHQTEALAQKEALYNDAERIVKERAMLAIAKRKRIRRQRIENDNMMMMNNNNDGEDDDEQQGPERPIYISNKKILEETGFPCVMVYHSKTKFGMGVGFSSKNNKNEDDDEKK